MNTVRLEARSNEARINIVGSEFIAVLKTCTSAEQASLFQKELREQHSKASHHCLAYRVGAESVQEFASDDGEPSGTAGIPMLNVLKRHDLTNIAAVVVRYFGGTKLGKRGLIDAYRRAVEKALEGTSIQEIKTYVHIDICFPYQRSNHVNAAIHDFGASRLEEEFGEAILIKLLLEPTLKDSFVDRVVGGFESEIHVNILGKVFR